MLTLKLFKVDKYLNGSPEMPLNHKPANLLEHLFGDKLVTARPSLGSIALLLSPSGLEQ